MRIRLLVLYLCASVNFDALRVLGVQAVVEKSFDSLRRLLQLEQDAGRVRDSIEKYLAVAPQQALSDLVNHMEEHAHFGRICKGENPNAMPTMNWGSFFIDGQADKVIDNLENARLIAENNRLRVVQQIWENDALRYGRHNDRDKIIHLDFDQNIPGVIFDAPRPGTRKGMTKREKYSSNNISLFENVSKIAAWLAVNLANGRQYPLFNELPGSFFSNIDPKCIDWEKVYSEIVLAKPMISRRVTLRVQWIDKSKGIIFITVFPVPSLSKSV